MYTIGGIFHHLFASIKNIKEATIDKPNTATATASSTTVLEASVILPPCSMTSHPAIKVKPAIIKLGRAACFIWLDSTFSFIYILPFVPLVSVVNLVNA